MYIIGTYVVPGSIIGICNLGDINSHLIALEKQDTEKQPPELANSMLVFYAEVGRDLYFLQILNLAGTVMLVT